MTNPATTRDDLLISPQGLLDALDSDRPIVLLDIRYTPGGESRRAEYEAGHLPGAHWVELASQLSGPRTATSGNNPLPDPDALQADVRRWGIGADSLVVVYGETGSPSPARGWFVLTWAGVPDVRFLDGGIDAWLAAGGALVQDEPAEADGTFVLAPGGLPTIDADEAGELARTGLLLDARGAKQYEGAVDARGSQGHIPGAVSAPTAANLDEHGLLRPEAQLRARFADLSLAPGAEVGVYCGGGVAAAHQALVLRTLGIAAPLFVGSWSAWSADASRPVAVGPEAG